MPYFVSFKQILDLTQQDHISEEIGTGEILFENWIQINKKSPNNIVL